MKEPEIVATRLLTVKYVSQVNLIYFMHIVLFSFPLLLNRFYLYSLIDTTFYVNAA